MKKSAGGSTCPTTKAAVVAAKPAKTECCSSTKEKAATVAAKPAKSECCQGAKAQQAAAKSECCSATKEKAATVANKAKACCETTKAAAKKD